MEIIFSTEEEQYAYEQERQLWEQEPAKIGTYVSQSPAVTTSPFAELGFALGKANTERIEQLQQKHSKVSFNTVCTVEELCKAIGVTSIEAFKEDYHKWKAAVYTKEPQKNTATVESKKKAGVKDFLEEIKAIEHKKEAPTLPKPKEGKSTIDVKLEGNTEETEKLEEWLDDILS